jgi:hypothetical protein
MTNGLEEIDLGWFHDEPLQSGMVDSPKGSMRSTKPRSLFRLRSDPVVY